MTARVIDGRLHLYCKGLAQLRVKTELNRLLGSGVECCPGSVSVPSACSGAVLAAFPDLQIEDGDDLLSSVRLHEAARREALDSLANKKTNLVPQRWKDRLDVPQQYAVNAMVTQGLRGLCLFDEQGSGKTVMSLAAYEILVSTGIIDAAIIVAPKSMLPGWEKDIMTFLGQSFSVAILEGSKKDKVSKIADRHPILVVNYEGIGNILGALKFFAAGKNVLLIADESYYAKNPNAVRSDNIAKVRPACQRCFVLCGTPAPNKSYDLINQLNLSDNMYSFPSFVRSSDEVADAARIQEGLELRSTVIRRLKEDILSFVPVKNFEIVRVKLSGRQKEMYLKARDELLVELRRYDNTLFKKKLTSYFQRRETLLQICTVPSHVDGTFSGDSAKLVALDQKLGELFAQNRKVIVWTAYKASIVELMERYSNYMPLVIYGETSTDKRKEAVELFQNDPARMLLIANPAACGAGITLHAAYDAVYYSYTNQAANYLQSLDRIHRRGQRSSVVNYYLFVCEGTIEEGEVARLRDREVQQHHLLHDDIKWPTSLDDAIAELLQDQGGV